MFCCYLLNTLQKYKLKDLFKENLQSIYLKKGLN
nr:MAG TPA: hypothetical protein [Crassvirales sp.]